MEETCKEQSEQPHLVIDPAHLLCVMDLVLRAKMTDEQRGRRVVESHIPSHGHRINIGVAVAAQVAEGIVLTNIVCQVT